MLYSSVYNQYRCFMRHRPHNTNYYAAHVAVRSNGNDFYPGNETLDGAMPCFLKNWNWALTILG